MTVAAGERSQEVEGAQGVDGGRRLGPYAGEEMEEGDA